MQNNESKPYNPRETEPKIYRLWENSGYFNPDNLAKRKAQLANRKNDKRLAISYKPFCIIMPPPNANGSLHVGHAVFVTLEDIMTRYHRMKGDAALWLPGADHAGFETQVVFEKKLEKEGRNRFEIPREQLYDETLEFTLKNKKIMEDQLRRLGASCDWSREKFTLDKDIIKAVYQTFKKLHDDGLAYRDSRPVNWCAKHQTSLSELEVKYEEQKDPLYYIKYGPLVLATVRLETKFGDTAVAVHPDDKRYKKYIGQTIDIETVIGPAKIKVIADKHVDPDFGTGVVKITPAHDPNDFEVGKRHGLEVREVIDRYGRLNEKAGHYKGMKIMEARAKIAQDMQAKGLIEKIDEDYTHTVGHCYKCGAILEPRILPQWFIAVNKKGKQTRKTLAKDAIEAVKNDKVKFVSKRFEKIFMHWMKNIRDWNISRQIVWGIRIPAWYKNNEIYIGEEPPKGDGWTQDTDVFDTWFSSGQWPFATLQTTNPPPHPSPFAKGGGRREGVTDFEKFYPTAVMETGWDILFFWVARMIMLGLYITNKEPFKHVFLHGMIRDKDRQKMSKSKGNVIDPLGIVDEHGADALRMSLVFGASAGNDIIVAEDKVIAHKRFANKIWNAAKFVLNAVGEDFKNPPPHPSPFCKGGGRREGVKLTKEDKWILKELQKTTKKVTDDIEKFKFHEAAQEAYHFFWHKFCDKTIEDVKIRIAGDSPDADAGKLALWTVLYNSLKLLHPFMPFVTETIYQKLPQKPKEMLMIENWPKP